MGIGSIASTGWQYFKRACKLYPDFVLGTGNDEFTQAMRQTVNNRKVNGQSYLESIWSGIKKGTTAAEKHNEMLQQKHGGFWKSTWESLKTTPKKIMQGWKTGGRKADRAGKTGFSKGWTQFKGALSGLGKRMPLIFTLMAIIPEIPNIFSAFKDEGLGGGVKETGKTALRVGAGTAVGAITQALIPIPFLGFIVGYTAGDWLMSKVTGKSHSEKKLEAEEALIQQQASMQNGYGMSPFSNPYYMINNNQMQTQTLNTPQMTMTPQQLMTLQHMLYSNTMANPMDQDFMAMTSGINRLNFQC